jgi:hypothetical protein
MGKRFACCHKETASKAILVVDQGDRWRASSAFWWRLGALWLHNLSGNHYRVRIHLHAWSFGRGKERQETEPVINDMLKADEQYVEKRIDGTPSQIPSVPRDQKTARIRDRK